MTVMPLSPVDPGIDPRVVPFARDLAAHGDRVALVTAEGELSYRDLAARVAGVARRLGAERRLVLLAGANRVDALVTYLAALAGGHPVLLVPGDSPASLAAAVAAYDPDVVVGPADGGWRIEERRALPAHPLHPDLALLLTTSGSTGSPRLVRLSHQNLQANAEAIAGYLDLRATDRAATTLPMHYCYGLSVINSHLLRGASLILTSRSVADPGFWELFREHRGTSLAGVPYTFDLLDRVGFDRMRLPHLRYVTQAGGRLAPDRVRHYARLGRRQGWRLFVMYGQTEATARMAYLPPDLAEARPQCVGVPIPGGSLRLEPLPDWPEPDTGELVYAGPNVMLGYAETRADLALGRTVTELRTGDVARRTGDGLYEIVGRRSRFIKLFGLRIDLHRVEAALARHGVTACCVGDDRELVVVATGDRDTGALRRLAARESGLPVRAVRVHAVAALPRLANGKPDYRAVQALARATGPVAPAAGAAPLAAAGSPPATLGRPPDPGADLRALFAEVLGRRDVTDESSFVSLGGDSLSYVEMSVRLERALGRLPDQWHTTPIRELAATAARGARRGRTVDTTVALRAVSIVLIVGTHATLFGIAGGAHLLLGVAGFNFARFRLGAEPRRTRVRHIGRSIARVAVASMTWIALAFLLTDDYSPANVFLLHYLVGSDGGHDWHFWFIESLVYIQLAALAVLALPLVDRLERRFPFGLPLAPTALGLVTRYELVPGVELPTPAVAGWLFTLGWAAARATDWRRRTVVTLAVVATIPGFFGDAPREAVMIVGLVLLVWVTRLPSLGPLNRVAGVLAGGSLYIYLTHWQVYPHLMGVSPLLALLASLAVGVLYAAVVTRVGGALAARWRDRRRPVAASV
jgi:acyl-CoA synthetase (AMP-forming)/AMP-acid ligase II